MLYGRRHSSPARKYSHGYELEENAEPMPKTIKRKTAKKKAAKSKYVARPPAAPSSSTSSTSSAPPTGRTGAPRRLDSGRRRFMMWIDSSDEDLLQVIMEIYNYPSRSDAIRAAIRYFASQAQGTAKKLPPYVPVQDREPIEEE